MKIVLGFGLILGAVGSVVQLVTLPFIRTHDLRVADFLGYGSMVLTALLLFFGIRAYREGTGGGRLTFARGLAVGALIALVSSLCYAATFQSSTSGSSRASGTTWQPAWSSAPAPRVRLTRRSWRRRSGPRP